MIYCNTKKRVVELADKMKEHDFGVSIMHGEMDQMRSVSETLKLNS